MNPISDELKKAAVSLSENRNPISIVGTTGSGKSTIFTTCAASLAVQKLLVLREASGKGTVTETKFTITDYDVFPEDKLAIIVTIKSEFLAERADDNEFIGGILYDTAKAMSKSSKVDYLNQISKELDARLSKPENDTLAYKIKNITDDQKVQLAKRISRIPKSKVCEIYNFIKDSTSKKDKRSCFIKNASEKDAIADHFRGCLEKIVEFINEDRDSLLSMLSQNNACELHTQEDASKFLILLGEEDVDKDITKFLLKSEDESKEYLFSELSIIFRGAASLFDIKNERALTIATINGKEVHCLQLIDTQGLFHTTGVKPEQESERIMGLLTKYHSPRLLLVLKSSIDNIVKDGYNTIKTLLRTMNKTIEVYLLFTYWDEYLCNFARQNNTSLRFRSQSIDNTDWNETFKDALNAQEKQFEDIEHSINDSFDDRPIICGHYRTSLTQYTNEAIADKLHAEGIRYEIALQKISSDLAEQIQKIGPKLYIRSEEQKGIKFEGIDTGDHDISKLYKNLVSDCQGKKLYASTVRACIDRWLILGEKHTSCVSRNFNGYEDIETSFVDEISMYAMSYLKLLTVKFQDQEENAMDLEDRFRNYLSNQQVFGRTVARKIGVEAHDREFKTNTFKYQYELFNDMLEYIETTYFMSESVPCTDRFKAKLNEALSQCISNFICEQCIVSF